MLRKGALAELQDKVKLCDSFINKEIDVEYYSKQKEDYLVQIKGLKQQTKLFVTIFSIFLVFVLFGALFFLIFYILSQFI